MIQDNNYTIFYILTPANTQVYSFFNDQGINKFDIIRRAKDESFNITYLSLGDGGWKILDENTIVSTFDEYENINGRIINLNELDELALDVYYKHKEIDNILINL